MCLTAATRVILHQHDTPDCLREYRRAAATLPRSGRRPLQQAPRAPPLQDRNYRKPTISPRRGFMVSDSPWLGPQTVLDGRPPALMDAGVESRGSLRCSRRWSPRRRSLRCSRSSGPPEPSTAVGETCERGVWNLTEKLVWLSPNPPLPLSPQRSPASRFHSETPAGPGIIAPAVVPARAPRKPRTSAAPTKLGGFWGPHPCVAA